MASRMALASATMIGKTRRNTAGGMVAQPGKRRSRSAEVNVDGVRVSKPNAPMDMLMTKRLSHEKLPPKKRKMWSQEAVKGPNTLDRIMQKRTGK